MEIKFTTHNQDFVINKDLIIQIQKYMKGMTIDINHTVFYRFSGIPDNTLYYSHPDFFKLSGVSPVSIFAYLAAFYHPNKTQLYKDLNTAGQVMVYTFVWQQVLDKLYRQVFPQNTATTTYYKLFGEQHNIGMNFKATFEQILIAFEKYFTNANTGTHVQTLVTENVGIIHPNKKYDTNDLMDAIREIGGRSTNRR